jgi:hypothetical protein
MDNDLIGIAGNANQVFVLLRPQNLTILIFS